MRVRTLSVLVALPAALLAPGARAADYAGAESCRSCHPEAWEVWRASQHARSFEALSKEQRKDARCLQCHARDAAQGADPSVSCETCHGAGRWYWPSYVMRDPELARYAGLVLPDAKTCQGCHDASSPALEPFDVAAKMQLIDHWTKARAERAKKAQAPADKGAPARAGAAKPGPAPAGGAGGDAPRRPSR